MLSNNNKWRYCLFFTFSLLFIILLKLLLNDKITEETETQDKSLRAFSVRGYAPERFFPIQMSLNSVMHLIVGIWEKLIFSLKKELT
jgi:hypothetical protein